MRISSPKSLRMRRSAWLIAGWDSPTRSAAAVTERSSSSAWRETSRFRSTLARVTPSGARERSAKSRNAFTPEYYPL